MTDVPSDMEVSLVLDLSAANGSQTMILDEPDSVRMSDQVRTKRNRAPCIVQQKKVTKYLAI